MGTHRAQPVHICEAGPATGIDAHVPVKTAVPTPLNICQVQDLKDVLVAAVTTGMRLGELMDLRLEDVNLINRTIHVKSTEELLIKNRKNRLLPINLSLSSVLDRRISNNRGGRGFQTAGRRMNSDSISKGF